MVNETAVPSPAEAPPDESWMVRSMRFLLLLAVALSTLVYPLNIERNLYRDLIAPLSGNSLGQAIIRLLDPFLQYSFSPLVLKETLSGWALLFFVAFWASWKLFSNGHRRARPRMETLLLLGFLVWCLAAAWRAPHFGLDSDCAYTIFNTVLWILAAVAALDIPWSADFARRAVRWILGIGLTLMVISVAQATSGVSDLIFKIMLRYESPYNRNLYGSLIGHNTGVASACLGPFFFALGLLLQSRRTRDRILLTLYLALGVCFFLVTQSRAIWGILLVLIPLFILGLRHLIRWRLPLKRLAIGAFALALLAVSQTVPSPVNFLNIVPSEYMSRIHGMKPSVILEGTRVRVIAVCLPWIARRPIAGYGLGSFSIVYPAAQAEYFHKHLDTRLKLVPRETLHAHNEYLQLLLETGAIGLGLAALSALFFARRALRRMRRLDSPSERLRRYCAAFAMLGILLHAFTDFPFHIVPLATLFLLYAVLLHGHPTDSETPDMPVGAPPLRRGGARIATFIAIMLIWTSVGIALAYTSRRLYGDMLASSAARTLEAARDSHKSGPPSTQVFLLGKAREEFRRSLRVDPLQYMNMLQHAQCSYGLADMYASARTRARQDGRGDLERSALLNIQRFLDAAQAQLREASQMARPFGDTREPYPMTGLGPRISLPLAYTYARTWIVSGEMGIAPDLAGTRALEALRKTVYYRPNLPPPLVETLTLMEKFKQGTPEERDYYRRLLARSDLDLLTPSSMRAFFPLYTAAIRHWVESEDFDTALAATRHLLAFMPRLSDSPDIPRILAHVGLLRHSPGLLDEALGEMRRVCPEYAEIPLLEAGRLVMQQRYGEALPALENGLQGTPDFWQKNPSLQRQWKFVEAETLRRCDRVAEADALSSRTLASAPTPSQGLAERGRMKLAFFGDTEGGMSDLRAAAMSSPPMESANAILELGRYAAARGDIEGLERVLEIGRKRMPENSAFVRLISSAPVPSPAKTVP